MRCPSTGLPAASVRTVWLALSLLALSATGPRAEDAKPPAVTCQRSGDTSVVSRARAEDPGEDIYVRTASAPSAGEPCAYAPKDGDWTVGQGDPDYVLALQGRFLVLDSGTGDTRRLLILDTGSRKTTINTVYDDTKGRFAAGPDGITYWRIGPRPVKPALCPAAWRQDKDHRKARQAHRTYEVRFDPARGAARDTGKTDCRLTEDDIQ